ncbi:O-antigen ligase domain-containing protein [Pleurocapsales cyanobacterium LEGE 10410]|nr:O-antigen ligase domain-containing protein [Pleurocapsales cyanobacterium LEGE 10410]
MPFILCFGTLFYGLLVGLIQNPIDHAIVDFLGWLCPLSFGFYLFVNWKYYPQYRQVIQQSFLWGTFIMGSYGIIQFCTAPQWERFWFDYAGVTSFGVAEPFGIRVMSTMGSPQEFATTMMAGLILLFSNKKEFLSLPTNIVGYLTFLLSQARAGWLGFSVGLFIFVSFSKLTTQIKVFIGIAAIVLILLPLINTEPFSSIVFSRFESLSNVETDSSLDTRLSAYQNLFNLAVSEVTGKGLGYTIDFPGFGARDGAILPTLFVFGWLGILPLLSGIGLLFFKIFYNEDSKSDKFNIVAKAICLGVLAQIGFNFIFISAMGIIFWSFLGAGLASQRYYLSETKFFNSNKS